MITAWILYAVVVGTLLGAGAMALEKLLRVHGLSSRWVWACAILLSVAWPTGHWIWESRPEPAPAAMPLSSSSVTPALSEAPSVQPEFMAVEVPPESILHLLDGPVLVAWGLTAGLLLLFFTFLFVRTHQLRRGWRKERVKGHAVLFSEEWGPAVVGFVQPQIVLPGWCRDLDDWSLRFILDHELEHVRAGDLRLFIVAGLMPVLVPWHLPVWWQLTRLRTAIEGDCDLRVLERNPGQTRSYVDLLLAVGERSPVRRPLAAMLSEPYNTLKRRIGIMTMPLPKHPWVRGGLLAATGAVLLALACWAPGPMDGAKEEDSASIETAASGSSAEAGEDMAFPTFTPFSVRPTIKNREEIIGVLEGRYPPALEDADVGGTVEVWLFVDEEGVVRRLQVNETSGHKELDDAAVGIAHLLEFTPALNRDQPRPVWVSLPVIFATSGRHEAVVDLGGVVTHPVREPVPTTGERGAINGTVTDLQAEVPLAGVQVFVLGTGRGTLTDQEGRFLIEHVPVGEREVAAHLIGYRRIVEEVDVTAETTADVGFDLQVTAISLDALVVMGGRAGDGGGGAP